MVIVFKRVAYRKQSTSPKNREYSLGFGAPVGTKKEIYEWAKSQGIKKSEINFTERDFPKERTMFKKIDKRFF